MDILLLLMKLRVVRTVCEAGRFGLRIRAEVSGLFVPWTIRIIRTLHRVIVPWTVRTQCRPFVPWTVRSVHGRSGVRTVKLGTNGLAYKMSKVRIVWKVWTSIFFSAS